MFSFCVDHVSRMEYKPEVEDCDCRRSKDDLRGSGKDGHADNSRTKKVSSPAALDSPKENGNGRNSHFFGRTKKVSAPPSAQFEALLSAAMHLRERKRSAHEPPPTATQNHGHHHIFQPRQQQQNQQQHHASTHLLRHLANHHHHNGQQGHHHSQQDQHHPIQEVTSGGHLEPAASHQARDGEHSDPVPVAPQRKGARKERKKGSALAPPTLEQLQAAVLEEAAKHGKRNTGPAHPLNIFGRTKKVSAPPVAQFDAVLAANAKMREDQERKRSVHAPSGENHQHHPQHNHQHLHHHTPQRLDNLSVHSPGPALLTQRKCIGGQRRRRELGEEQVDLRLDGLWISRCEGDLGRVSSRTPAEIMAHELDTALAAAARRRKERSCRISAGARVDAGCRRAGRSPAEALGAEMDSALTAALIRRERKLTVAGHGKEWGRPGVTAGGGHGHLHRSLEMLSRG